VDPTGSNEHLNDVVLKCLRADINTVRFIPGRSFHFSGHYREWLLLTMGP